MSVKIIKVLFHKILCSKKIFKKEKQCKTDKNEKSSEHTETDEDDDSDHEKDADCRFIFTRTVTDEIPIRKRIILEFKKKNADAIAAHKECERAIDN